MIAFGSCLKADKPAPLIREVADVRPDLLLMLGDNVYVDIPEKPGSVWDFRRKYMELEKRDDWQRLCTRSKVIGTWDDHDYGLNDAGKNWRLKEEAKSEFMRFFDIAEDAPMRSREGVYSAHCYGPRGRTVQVILLDTRTFRDPLRKKLGGMLRSGGPYLPHTDTDSTLLGETQWEWLANQLRRPADVRVIASSIQVIPDESGWECWGNFPHERQRLFDLIGQTGANGVVILSGDRHHAEASSIDDESVPYGLWDVTSSGMNQPSKGVNEPNRFRVGPIRRTANVGYIHIDWSRRDPLITMQVKGVGGELLVGAQTRLSQLQVH